jgi:DNA-binding CsgD family transcriptional regulator
MSNEIHTYNPKPSKYPWTKEEEDMVLAMYANGKKISDIAQTMGIRYTTIVSLLQRKLVVKNRTQDHTLIAYMAKIYTISEICEQLKMSESSLIALADRHKITLARSREQLPRTMPMPPKINTRTCATLASAVAQANSERYAIVSKHTYMRDTIYMGRRCTSVEFRVINERHPRLWDNEITWINPSDVYVKTPEGGHFVIPDEEVSQLSNVINNNITIILTDNE